jgi:hypothetical protein
VKLCSVDGCGNEHHANGFCSSHYFRDRRATKTSDYYASLAKKIRSYGQKKAMRAIEAREFRHAASDATHKHKHVFLHQVAHHVGKGRDAGDIAVRMGIRVSVVASAIKQLQEMANPQTA